MISDILMGCRNGIEDMINLGFPFFATFIRSCRTYVIVQIFALRIHFSRLNVVIW
jgi:hypothetical protein